MTPVVSRNHSSTQQSSTQQSGCSAFTDLQDNASGLVEVHHLFDDWLKELPVTCAQKHVFTSALHSVALHEQQG